MSAENHQKTRQHNYQSQLALLSPQQKQSLAKKLGIVGDKAKAKLVACATMVNDEAISSKQIKTFAESVLPEHFIPQVFKQVKTLPKTTVGKIDRKHAQDFSWQELPAHKQASIIDDSTNSTEDDLLGDDDFDIFGDSNYIAPSNETEETLAAIWSEVLGVADISVHDEFIELGGDSLLSIRILARINKAGLSIATEDFFEYPTIAGQAKAISKAKENSYEPGSTKGHFELIPIQHWLFERISINTQHWNQSVLLSVDESLDYVSLERAFQNVLMQHDSLRLSFAKQASGQWQQTYLAPNNQLPLERIDISQPKGQVQTSNDSQSELIEQHCQLMNESMDLANGPLVRMAFFETGEGQANQVALVVHHLIIDAESWRILLEDLQSAWLGFAQGISPSLPRKTTSFKHWSEKLIEYAQSPALLSELNYWQAQACNANIPVDFKVSAKDNNEASTKVITTTLDIQSTQKLLNDAPKKLGVEVRDLLLSALVLALQSWSKQDKIVIDIEGHGREDLFERVDISRTIGWFTTVFPSLFNLDSLAKPSEALLAVKETLKAIPNKGIGHGVLRENSNDTSLKQQSYSQVCFNYLGQIDAHQNEQQTSPFTLLKHNVGKTRSPDCLRAFYLEINAKISSSQLHIDWSYSRNIHHQSTIENLSHDYESHLSELLVLENIKALTDSDDNDDDLFDLAEFGDDEMAAISKALSDDK